MAALNPPDNSLSGLKDCCYRAEGNSSLVISLVIGNEDKVIRLEKTDITDKNKPNRDALFKKFSELIRYTKDILVPLFGENLVSVPDIITLNAKEVSAITDIVKHCRPSHRKKKFLPACDTYALALPDFCAALPRYFGGVETRGPVIAVEIKPKRGFLKDVSDPRLSTKPYICTYCMRQYYNLQQEMITKRSRYCPLDLFSGCPKRMEKAILALFESPQNNCRIFKDKMLIYCQEKRCDLSFEMKDFFDASMSDQ